MRRFSILLSFLIMILNLVSCSEFSTDTSGPSSGGTGITPGGVQDIGYFRSIIENGEVPSADLLSPEGIFSEYDLPIDGPPPDQLITTRAAHAYADDFDIPGGGLYVQIGLSSSIQPDEFHRPDLNLSIVIDRSGSMASDSKFSRVKYITKLLIDKLDESDILSIILFDTEIEVLSAPASVDNADFLKRAIDNAGTGGGTNMSIGLAKGFEFIRQNLNEDGKSSRLILITDANANQGNTSPEHFYNLIDEASNDNIGFTAWGIGIDFNQETINVISDSRGGNYYYLNENESNKELLDNSFDFMVTPVAYDFELQIDASGPYQLIEGFGFSKDSPEGYVISSLFLSHNRGASLLKFSPGANPIRRGDVIAEINIDYVEPNSAERHDELRVVFAGDDVINEESFFFQQDGVRMTVALLREILCLKEACGSYKDDAQNEAVSMLDKLKSFLERENGALDNRLRKEIDMVIKLRENMNPE